MHADDVSVAGEAEDYRCDGEEDDGEAEEDKMDNAKSIPYRSTSFHARLCLASTKLVKERN